VCACVSVNVHTREREIQYELCTEARRPIRDGDEWQRGTEE